MHASSLLKVDNVLLQKPTAGLTVEYVGLLPGVRLYAAPENCFCIHMLGLPWLRG